MYAVPTQLHSRAVAVVATANHGVAGCSLVTLGGMQLLLR